MPCVVEFPALSAPTTPPPKNSKVSHSIATPPDESPAIPAVEEIDSDQELLPASPQLQSGTAYGKGGGRGGTDARREADPYEVCSPVTPASQPLSVPQPAQVASAEDDSSVAQGFQKGAVTVALVQ